MPVLPMPMPTSASASASISGRWRASAGNIGATLDHWANRLPQAPMTLGHLEHESMRAWEPAGVGLPRAASTARAGPLIHNYTQLKGRDARASHVDPRAGCRLIWGRGGRRKRPCEQGTSQGGRPFMESKNKPNAPQDPTYEPHTSERTHPPRKD